ncbi:MAG TPA: xanthine dehydrogenase family protein subunit M [Conexivisphaerales archaeon]|nr:xanthine dehydrogenase family protein subunit M [Conexivisphaerales archaeon]
MMYTQVEVRSPKTLAQALNLLAQDDGLRIVSGGTDVAVYLKDGNLKEGNLLDISHVEGLSYVRDRGRTVSVGARTTFSQIVESGLIRRSSPLLAEASAVVGSLQIRNLATLAGNICNASPAADSLPPLYVHEAAVVLSSRQGSRKLPIRDFILGPRKTARRPDEMLTEVLIPKLPSSHRHFFRKLGLRSSQAITVASVAASWKGRDARISLGAVAPTVVRATRAEEFILEHGLDRENLNEVCLLVSEAASPITDLRASKQYRLAALRALAYQGFYEAMEGDPS